MGGKPEGMLIEEGWVGGGVCSSLAKVSAGVDVGDVGNVVINELEGGGGGSSGLSPDFSCHDMFTRFGLVFCLNLRNMLAH